MTTPISNNPLTPRPPMQGVAAPGATGVAPAAEPSSPQQAAGAGPASDAAAVGGAGPSSEIGLTGTTGQWADLIWTDRNEYQIPPASTTTGDEIVLATAPPLPDSVTPPPDPVCEPAPPPIRMASVSVGGSGMGAPVSKTLTMTEDELIAVYTVFKQKNGGMISFEELAKTLKEQYGIDAEVKNEDGMMAVVNRETGNVIAMDSNGDGMLTTTDMGFEKALTDLGIDPNNIQASRNDGLAMAAQVAKDALDTVEKMEQRRRADVEASRGIEAAATRTPTTGGQTPQGSSPQATPAAEAPSGSTPSATPSTPSTKTPSV